MAHSNELPWGIKKIIEVSNSLVKTGRTGGSTGEVIAAAFALNRMEYIPHGYSVVEAWERLDDEWQEHVKQVRYSYLRQ